MSAILARISGMRAASSGKLIWQWESINMAILYPGRGTPTGAHNNKAQGIGVHFPDDESGQRARLRIEEILGAALRSSRATHTL